EKLHSLDKRLSGVLRLFKNTPVELKPAQFAIDKIFRSRKTFFLRTILREQLDLCSRLLGNSGFGNCCMHIRSWLNKSPAAASGDSVEEAVGFLGRLATFPTICHLLRRARASSSNHCLENYARLVVQLLPRLMLSQLGMDAGYPGRLRRKLP